MKLNKVKVEFVDKIPSKLAFGILYVCINCNVIVHKCACGCGEKTVTPIDKKYGWIMKYDGQTITLRPSIGNFNMRCKSHYYITDNRIEWLEEYKLEESKKSWIKQIKQFIKSKWNG